MCGLAGLVIGKKNRTEMDYHEICYKFSSLMAATETRGRHATGAFVVNRTTGISYHKAPLPASRMIYTEPWKELMDLVTEDTVAIIGHVRYATQGSPSENSNNHPIIMNDVIGVHNGIITNDCELCDKYPFEQEVDSAAIFSAIQHNTKKSRLSTDTLARVLPELKGNFAIMLADKRRTDSIFVARDGSRPVVYIRDEDEKLIWLSSTGDILRDGLGLDSDAVATMMPAYSIARLSVAHAGKSQIKYTIWHKPAKIKPIVRHTETFDWDEIPASFDDSLQSTLMLNLATLMAEDDEYEQESEFDA